MMRVARPVFEVKGEEAQQARERQIKNIERQMEFTISEEEQAERIKAFFAMFGANR